MVNEIDPTRRRQLRVMKLKASRGKLKLNSCDKILEINLSVSSDISKQLSTSEEKKHARQIRNRQAAITSRQRYLADAELLRQKVSQLEAENKSLIEYISKLHSEKATPVQIQMTKLPKPEIYCAKEHAKFHLRGISPTSHCREINLQ